jgi:biopolymer transport protein ExbD
MRRLSLASTSENDIDMTPMLDIVFIMLIFFIVTSSFLKESALEFARPSASPPTHGPSTPLALLELTADNRIVGDGRELDLAVLPALLEQKLSTDPTTAVLIQAHHDSSTALLLQLVDAAKKVGISKVSVGSYGAI